MLAEGGLFKEVRAKKLGWLVLIDPKKSNEDRRRQILTALVLFFLNLISSFLSHAPQSGPAFPYTFSQQKSVRHSLT